MKKAFFFDIDGTLVYPDNKELVVSRKSIDAISKLRSKGYKTFIATGRTEAFVPSSVYDLDMDGFVTANGSVVRIDGKLVYEKLFPEEAVNNVLDFCEQNNHSWMFEGDKAYVESLESKELKNFYNSVIVNQEKIIEAKNLDNAIIYNALIMADYVDLDALRDALGKGYVVAEHFSCGYVDCYLENHTKADGISKVIEHLDLEGYKTYAFGDGNNDLEMFDKVDCGIAMNNASDKLKAKASLITKSNFEDGIFHALKELNLI